MSTLRRPRLLSVGPRAALLELALLAIPLAVLASMMSLAADPSQRTVLLQRGLLYAGVWSAVFVSLRLRPSGQVRWWRRLGYELGMATAVPTLIGAVVWLFDAVHLWRVWVEAGSPATEFVTTRDAAFVQGMFAVVVSGMAYTIVRTTVLVWVVWTGLRRRRLLWSLTHALVVVAVGLAVMAAVVILVQDYRESETILQRGVIGSVAGDQSGEAIDRASGVAFGYVLGRVIVTAIILVALSLMALAVVLPPTLLMSFIVLRPVTRRLEDLTAATAALRAGNLAARVPVGGEDELARLQTDFNAMATDLEKAMRSLQQERDRVGGLLQARRELIAAVSHELRTPVASLRAYLDSAISHWDGSPPATLRQDMETMLGEAERLQRLIEDLFDLSRAEVGRLTLNLAPTDVGAVLDRSARAAAPMAWERGRVEVLAEVPPDLPPARADAGRLEQVVRNLVANAVRHTPPGGLVMLTAARADGEIVVQVKDTGEGIAPQDLPRVWERFYRTGNARERDRGGAGLGLALVKELTEAMGGRVGVESVPGEGSCFTIRLPAVGVPSLESRVPS
ncbi:MAG TPA: ATP-binding protein [Chloroflexota bacterium]|nr:ATP-binding protein [Chloroflexota bacterium]